MTRDGIVMGHVPQSDAIRVVAARPRDFSVGDRLRATDVAGHAAAFDVVAIAGDVLHLRRVRWYQRLWRWIWRRR